AVVYLLIFVRRLQRGEAPLRLTPHHAARVPVADLLHPVRADEPGLQHPHRLAEALLLLARHRADPARAALPVVSVHERTGLPRDGGNGLLRKLADFLYALGVFAQHVSLAAMSCTRPE